MPLGLMSFIPRSNCRDNYPYDLDGSERITRQKTGQDVYFVPWNGNNFQQLGCVSGLLPQLDSFVWGQAFGKIPSGPIVSALPVNLQWQINIPGMSKYLPNS